MAMAHTARSLRDYIDIFGLSVEQIVSKKVLDCGAGASPFSFQARDLGADVTAVDPAYSLSVVELSAEISRHQRIILEFSRETLNALPHQFINSPDAFFRYQELASQLFLIDYESHGSCYVAASLPDLPFGNGYFELAVCSHVLFNEREFSLTDHIAAITELTRVTAGEVLISPLSDIEGKRYGLLDQLLEQLRNDGCELRIDQNNCPDTNGENELLRVTRSIASSLS